MITASAPGKLFLFGEYAVLDGHLAIIAAVDRRARVMFAPGGDALVIGGSFFKEPLTLALSGLDAVGPASRVIAGVLAAKEYGARVQGGRLDVDTSALFDGDRKLGFGSSAAVCVATFAAMCGGAFDPARAFPLCKAWHNRAQGTNGSGGDVAASLIGGLACLEGDRLSRVDFVPPAAVLFHPQSASTPAFISNVKRFKADAPSEYARHVSGLGAIARRAAASREPHEWVTLTREATAALVAFGQASRTEIVTDYQREVSAICDRVGAASKPAGAGGGDVSLIVAPNDDVLTRAITAINGHVERLVVANVGAEATSR